MIITMLMFANLAKINMAVPKSDTSRWWAKNNVAKTVTNTNSFRNNLQLINQPNQIKIKKDQLISNNYCHIYSPPKQTTKT